MKEEEVMGKARRFIEKHSLQPTIKRGARSGVLGAAHTESLPKIHGMYSKVWPHEFNEPVKKQKRSYAPWSKQK